MNDPVAAREALMIEAIGEAGNLIESVKALTPVLQEIEREIAQAAAGLREKLAAFDGRMNAITENAKSRTVQHLAVRAEEATRRSIELQSRAMAEAARVAFSGEFGSTLQRLQSVVQQLVGRQGQRWERCLTHAAAAATASAVTWTLACALTGVQRSLPLLCRMA